MPPSAVVDDCYATRENAWISARSALAAWLNRQCDEILGDGDRMRLCVQEGRIKRRDRTLHKLRQRMDCDTGVVVSTWHDVEREVRDIVGVKVLCKSTRDQRLLIEHLRSVEDTAGIELCGVRDYVKEPKASGYRAVHVHFRVPVAGETEPVAIELQIKTRAQDAWGELTHEDLYKPGGGLKPSSFQGSVAKTIAELLAIVDSLADDLAVEIQSTWQSAEDSLQSDDTTNVVVRTTGPRYALAEDANGRRGLIPAYAVRDSAQARGFINVDDYLVCDDEVEVHVIDNDEGVFYIPIALPSRK